MSADRRASRPRNHHDHDELAVGWALHALEPEDEIAFARHLAACPRCVRTVAETSDVMLAMTTSLPQHEPSDQLRERLRTAVLHTGQVGTDDERQPMSALPLRAVTEERDHRPRPRVRMVLRAAAAAAIIGLGAATGALGISLQHARTDAAHQEAIVETLLGSSSSTLARLATPDGRPVATVVMRDGDAQVVSDGLQINDAQGSTYVLWGMGQGAPVALGTFDVTQSRPELHAIGTADAGQSSFATYGISLERGRSAPAVPTDVLATGYVSG